MSRGGARVGEPRPLQHRAAAPWGPQSLAGRHVVVGVRVVQGEGPGRRAPFKQIGNIYRAEVLFWERVHPETRIADVLDRARLWARAQTLMCANLPLERAMQTREGHPSHWVYGRARRRCLRCGTNVRSGPLGVHRRTVYWCPRCQPLD